MGRVAPGTPDPYCKYPPCDCRVSSAAALVTCRSVFLLDPCVGVEDDDVEDHDHDLLQQ